MAKQNKLKKEITVNEKVKAKLDMAVKKMQVARIELDGIVNTVALALEIDTNKYDFNLMNKKFVLKQEGKK